MLMPSNEKIPTAPEDEAKLNIGGADQQAVN